MAWEIELTDEAQHWYLSLNQRDRQRITAAIDALQDGGPTLGAPIVKSITSSRHQNMKELRSVGGNLRALFAFDPRRHAIVLLGGDKTGDWSGWYDRNIPLADDLYDTYLNELHTEGLI